MKNHNPEVGESGLVVMDNVILTRKEWKSRIDKVFKNKNEKIEKNIKLVEDFDIISKIYATIGEDQEVKNQFDKIIEISRKST